MFCCVALASLVSCSPGEGTEGRKSRALDSYGEATRAAIADAYKYELSKKFNRDNYLSDPTHTPYSKEMMQSNVMCKSKKFRLITKKMILSECLIISYRTNPKCKDIDGCIEFLVHESVKEDKVLNSLLIDVIKNPCPSIPQETRFHWRGFFFPNYKSSGILNCGTDELPYSRAYINYGNNRVELKL